MISQSKKLISLISGLLLASLPFVAYADAIDNSIKAFAIIFFVVGAFLVLLGLVFISQLVGKLANKMFGKEAKNKE
mgnify:CR=1 FL=1